MVDVWLFWGGKLKLCVLLVDAMCLQLNQKDIQTHVSAATEELLHAHVVLWE